MLDYSNVKSLGKFWQISAAINFSYSPSFLTLRFNHRFASAFPFPRLFRKKIAMNRKMSAVSNTHTKITASERVILNKETINALSKQTRRHLIYYSTHTRLAFDHIKDQVSGACSISILNKRRAEHCTSKSGENVEEAVRDSQRN